MIKIIKPIRESITNNDDSTILFVRKHYKYITLVFIIMILYISNGLIYELEIRKRSRLEENLLRAKVKYDSKLQELMEYRNYRKLLELSKKYGLGLEEPKEPPIKIEDEKSE